MAARSARQRKRLEEKADHLLRFCAETAEESAEAGANGMQFKPGTSRWMRSQKGYKKSFRAQISAADPTRIAWLVRQSHKLGRYAREEQLRINRNGDVGKGRKISIPAVRKANARLRSECQPLLGGWCEIG